MPTFSDVLTQQLRADPGRPLVTFYDHASGERVELSATTYANWVAKTASLLVEEHDLGRGASLRVDLPPHWLGTVFLGAAWAAGIVVTDDEEPDAAVCGPASLERWAPRAGRTTVLACSLLPLGVRFAEPLPPHVHDVGVEVWSQPDAFTAWDPPGPEDPALRWAGTVTTQAEMWAAAQAGHLLGDHGRLLSVTDPASPAGVATVTEPLVRGGSLVLVAHPDPARLGQLAADERVTAEHPAGAQGG